jgi:carboxylesterase type B
MPNDYFILGCISLQLKQLREKMGKQGRTEPVRQNILRPSSMTETIAINSSSRPPLSVSINRPISELFSSQYQDSDDEKVNSYRVNLNLKRYYTVILLSKGLIKKEIAMKALKK